MNSFKYIALLRGINVGGNAKVSMATLKSAMMQSGFGDVVSYINSGNIVFSSANPDTQQLCNQIESIIKSQFGFDVAVVVLTKNEWSKIISEAPKWWGNDYTKKHNLIVMLRPYDMTALMLAIGAPKPNIERVQIGEGVVYQSLSLTDFGKTTSGKLASNLIYKRMTIRNYNTAIKIAALLA